MVSPAPRRAPDQDNAPKPLRKLERRRLLLLRLLLDDFHFLLLGMNKRKLGIVVCDTDCRFLLDVLFFVFIEVGVEPLLVPFENEVPDEIGSVGTVVV
jgi:hypothetical protein